LRHRLFLVLPTLLLLGACTLPQSTSPTPVPTIRTEGQGVKCSSGDHGIDEVQFGWSWCYPSSWKFQERLQPSSRPSGVDVTFDIVNDLPRGLPGSGDFGFLIVGTYQIGSAADLQSWVAANIGSGEQLTSISWGNARNAGQDAGGRRFAITSSHVVEMDVRGEAIAAEMGKRLDSWKFD